MSKTKYKGVSTLFYEQVISIQFKLSFVMNHQLKSTLWLLLILFEKLYTKPRVCVFYNSKRIYLDWKFNNDLKRSKPLSAFLTYKFLCITVNSRFPEFQNQI